MVEAAQRKLRPVGWVACVVSCLVVLAYVGSSVWAQNEVTQVEGIVATQSRSLAQEGRLYYDLKQYPYTVCAYMPVFYGLMAGLYKAGLPILLSGRILSILALAAIFWLVWKTLLLYTKDKISAGAGLVLAGLTQPLLNWGTVGQVDTLAIAFTVAAFYQYSRFHLAGEESLDWAALFALLGLFTKQTVLSAPVSIFCLLALQDWRRALRFAGIVGGLGGAAVLGLNSLLDGRFLANTVFANMNPFAFFKLQQQLQFSLGTLSPLLLLALAGSRKAWLGEKRPLFLYLGVATSLFLATAGKVGADTNYQIEMSVLLVLCAAVSLHELQFFPLYFGGSRSAVTLLVLPLLLHGAQNLRMASSGIQERIGREMKFRAQWQELHPYLEGQGRVLSADSNALVHSQRRFEVEPLIFRLLIEAGRLDGSQVSEDLEKGRFRAVLLYENAADARSNNPEIPSLTAAQMQVLRKRYQVVKHAAGPYLSGLYVYEPTREIQQ